jgi:hypothetical protein
MDEAEWLACSDPTAMLRFIHHRVSDRQYRLFAVACARDELARAQAGQGYFNFGDELNAGLAEFFWDATRGYEAAVLAAESAADGGPQQHFPFWYVGWAVAAVDVAYAALGYDPDGLVSVPADRIVATVQRYTNHPASYLRDIFGNPFRPVAVEPTWLTWNDSTVVKMAQPIYDDRAFDRLPILADALEDAGCTDATILDHLRGPGPHVLGCFALDLVLGKS